MSRNRVHPTAPPFNPGDIIHRRTVESHRVELKATWNPQIAKGVVRTLCAFANDLLHLNGGCLVLGVEEKEGRPDLPPRGLEELDLEKVQKEIFPEIGAEVAWANPARQGNVSPSALESQANLTEPAELIVDVEMDFSF